MKERVDMITLRRPADAAKAVSALLAGKIAVMKMGSIWGLFFNPQIPRLADRLNQLKMREETQSFSLICTCGQAKEIADRERVNHDFYSITPDMCRKVIVRFPINTALNLPFPYNAGAGTVQFQSFEASHPILRELQRLLNAEGCPFLSGTSGNIHGAPAVETLADAKRLAALFNIEASFWGIKTETAVVDIPAASGENKGSFPIIGFNNPLAVEVQRLMNKTDRELTERYLASVFAGHPFETSLVYSENAGTKEMDSGSSPA
ncbi:MAG: Sua5/YciO/YrdC/YwlC family protein [Peptococcaceae bacterium]|nr:Sua5/YciO/YrdC/YwlC family protein [Peptococcaceae bacterium]